MESFLESPFESMNVNGHQQPSSISDASNNDFELDKILADTVAGFSNELYDVTLVPFDPNNSSEQFNIDDFTNTSDDQFGSLTLNESPLMDSAIGTDDLLALIDSFEKAQSLHSIITEHADPTNYYQPQPQYSPPPSVPIGNSPVEQKSIDNLIYAQAYVEDQNRIITASVKPKKSKSSKHQSTSVGPVDYIIHSGGCQPCTTVPLQNDYAYQQQLLEYDAVETKQIQIKCQPRSKFRPRTQNESKSSSHYLRCEDGIKPEYPTIHIPQTWAFQSDVNLIEVALMGLDKQPHPYTLDNKTSSDTFEDHALIFKQNDPNVLYFRLTNDDFQNGFKTFMIELIKGKQDDTITKDLIRSRQLEHSMLRFTRIFQVGKGEYQRDDGSEEFSSIMSEAYGDVDIEHMGPRYGPMCGQEMVYVVLKGRIVKSDLIFEIIENSTGWSYRIDNFTKNGNVVYFLMPAFPYPQVKRITVNIVIYYKGVELTHTTYLYKGSIDQDLAELRLNDPCLPTAGSSSMSNTFNPFDFFASTGACPTVTSRKTSSTKCTKRLNKKPQQK